MRGLPDAAELRAEDGGVQQREDGHEADVRRGRARDVEEARRAALGRGRADGDLEGGGGDRDEERRPWAGERAHEGDDDVEGGVGVAVERAVEAEDGGERADEEQGADLEVEQGARLDGGGAPPRPLDERHEQHEQRGRGRERRERRGRVEDHERPEGQRAGERRRVARIRRAVSTASTRLAIGSDAGTRGRSPGPSSLPAEAAARWGKGAREGVRV